MTTLSQLTIDAIADELTTDPERTTRRLIAQLEALGHKVTLQPATA